LREFIKKEHMKTVVRFLKRIGIVVVTILLSDMIGLWIFLLLNGQGSLQNFVELLSILLLLEGALIGAIGGFMYYGYSEYRIAGQAALWPTLASEQMKNWRKRRLSQQKWGIAMLIAGALLIFLGLLISFITSY